MRTTDLIEIYKLQCNAKQQPRLDKVTLKVYDIHNETLSEIEGYLGMTWTQGQWFCHLFDDRNLEMSMPVGIIMEATCRYVILYSVQETPYTQPERTPYDKVQT